VVFVVTKGRQAENLSLVDTKDSTKIGHNL